MKQNNIRRGKFSLKSLLLHLALDLVGMISFSIPGIGEFSDVIWAPLSAYLLMKMYPGTIGKVAGTIEFLEEMLPFTDWIPTFTITYLYNVWEGTRALNTTNSSKR
ncbi:MAG: hypothetical protein GXO24_03535 [Chlorobi bacterium]|nr:hypothetical protein [Chlorobiota bacterium]